MNLTVRAASMMGTKYKGARDEPTCKSSQYSMMSLPVRAASMMNLSVRAAIMVGTTVQEGW